MHRNASYMSESWCRQAVELTGKAGVQAEGRQGAGGGKARRRRRAGKVHASRATEQQQHGQELDREWWSARGLSSSYEQGVAKERGWKARPL